MLGPADPPPFRRINGRGSTPCLIVCDHASAAIPDALGDLGIDNAFRFEHIAWDIGAAWITERLAERFDAPALLAGYSRLVADCNRYLADPAVFIETSDTIEVSGNRAMTGQDRARRVEAIWRPYHDAIFEALEGFEENGITPALISVHTMTPQMRGRDPRPEAFTVCWDLDDRMAAPVLDRMRETDGIIVGDNHPYGLDIGEDFTVPEHAMRRGLAHLQFEVRQDLVANEDEARRWADLVHELTADLIADEGLRAVRHYWP